MSQKRINWAQVWNAVTGVGFQTEKCMKYLARGAEIISIQYEFIFHVRMLEILRWSLMEIGCKTDIEKENKLHLDV